MNAVTASLQHAGYTWLDQLWAPLKLYTDIIAAAINVRPGKGSLDGRTF